MIFNPSTSFPLSFLTRHPLSLASSSLRFRLETIVTVVASFHARLPLGRPPFFLFCCPVLLGSDSGLDSLEGEREREGREHISQTKPVTREEGGGARRMTHAHGREGGRVILGYFKAKSAYNGTRRMCARALPPRSSVNQHRDGSASVAVCPTETSSPVRKLAYCNDQLAITNQLSWFCSHARGGIFSRLPWNFVSIKIQDVALL